MALWSRDRKESTHTHTYSDVGLLGYHDLRASKVGPGFMNLMTEMNKHTHTQRMKDQLHAAEPCNRAAPAASRSCVSRAIFATAATRRPDGEMCCGDEPPPCAPPPPAEISPLPHAPAPRDAATVRRDGSLCIADEQLKQSLACARSTA